MPDPRPAQATLFGAPEPAKVDRGAYRSPRPSGYAAEPGTGPAGETCGTCGHCRWRELVRRRPGARPRRFYKCAAATPSWTNDRSSDVLLTSPACRHHEHGAPQPTHVHRVRTTWND